MKGPPVSGQAASATVIGAGFAAAVLLNYPGQLSYDSVVQLFDGRTGRYETWHPPVMAWLLGLGDSLIAGTGLFVLGQTCLCFGGLLSLLWLKPNLPWRGAALALVCVLTPQLLLYQGIVWKDVLFADAAVAGFVCLAHAARHWGRLAVRVALLCAAFALFVLAALTRQNGLVVMLCGSATLAALAATNATGPRWIAALRYGATGLLASGVLAAGGEYALETRAVGESGRAQQVRLLQAYDIVGAIAHDGRYRLNVLDAQAPALARAMRTDGRRFYTPSRNDPLMYSQPLLAALRDMPAGSLSRQWRDLLFRHIGLYLRVRTDAFRWVFLTPDVASCIPAYAGVTGPADKIYALGLTPRLRPQDRALLSYARRFQGTPVFSHAAFAALAAAALFLLLRRRGPVDLAFAGMLAAAIVFAASFFAISIACDYRYLYFLDLAALFAAFYAA